MPRVGVDQPCLPSGDHLSAGHGLVQGQRFPGLRAGGRNDPPGEKNPAHGELTATERLANRKLGRIQVRVEHTLFGVKRCRIVKDVLRNKAEGISDAVMKVACGLHNVRVEKR